MLAERKETEDSNYYLNLYTLGRFEIIRKNKGLSNTSARSTKLWNLFKYLLANKGKGIAPEIILENLYPNENYENPKNTLQNLVYRLRKLLSEEGINEHGCNVLFSNGCYSLSIVDNVWLDTDVFEEYIRQAELYKNENPEKAIAFFEKAIRIYGGDYFPELVYEDWVIPKRNYYRRLYIQSVLHLCSLYNQLKLHDEGIKVCEKAVQIEPYEEELHICFMEHLIGKGKIGEAQKHYEYITSSLYKQFGIKPTVEMQRIYQLLKKNQNKSNVNEHADGCLDDAKQDGAFYCDSGVFHSILTLEKRRSERTKDAVFPVSITLDDAVGTSESDNLRIFNDFRDVLIHSLRKGDVVTTLNDSQLLILLPKTEYKQVMMVVNRIIEQYKSCRNYENFSVKVKTYSVLPGN